MTILLVLGAALLAGCAGDGDGGELDGETFAAHEGLSIAREEATSWSNDAQLVGMIGIETSDAEAPEDWPDEVDFTADDDVGDGHAGVWFYGFQDPEENTLGVIVDANGQTVREPGTDQEGMFGQELDEWETGSDEAAQAAREDEQYSAVLEADDVQVIVGLAHPDQAPMPGQEGAFWYFVAESQAQDREASVFVDAQTGELHRG